jgi:hypothetical protein
VSPRESTQRRKVELCARNVREFCLNADFHVTFRDHFTCRKATTWDRRLYFPSEGKRAKDFFALRFRRLRPGVNPRTWGTKGQNTTSRPSRPLVFDVATTFAKIYVKKNTCQILCVHGVRNIKGVKVTSAVYRRKSVIQLLGKCCTINSLYPLNCVVNCKVIKRNL